MRVIRTFVVAVLLGSVAILVGSGPASASERNGAVTYSGVFDSVQYAATGASCGTNHTVTGSSWSVTVHGMSAKGDFVFPTFSYTFPGMKVSSPASGTTFVVHGQTAAGPLVVTLWPNGHFTYVISPYDNTGLGVSDPAIVCDSETYVGHLVP